MAKTCAIFAYLLLACSECHELFNNEASQSNYGACLSAAADKAEFLYSAFADVKRMSGGRRGAHTAQETGRVQRPVAEGCSDDAQVAILAWLQ
jgi:cytochrome c553